MHASLERKRTHGPKPSPGRPGIHDPLRRRHLPQSVPLAPRARSSPTATGREYPRFHLGPDVRHDRPQPSRHRRGGARRRREGLPHVQRHDPRGRRRTGRKPWRATGCPGRLKSIFINTGSESNEVALRMAKMYTGGYEVLALGGSWHGITGGASVASRSRATARATACRRPGVFVMPEPNAYRPYIAGLAARSSPRSPASSSRLKMFDMQSAGPRRRDHRRAGHQRRRRAGAAQVVHAGAAQGGRRSRHAADLRRGADRLRPHRQRARGSDYFGVVPDIMTMSKTLGGGLPLAARSPRPRRSRRNCTTSTSPSTPATSPTRCRPRWASRCWR